MAAAVVDGGRRRRLGQSVHYRESEALNFTLFKPQNTIFRLGVCRMPFFLPDPEPDSLL